MASVKNLLLRLSKLYAAAFWHRHVRALKQPEQAQAKCLRQILKQANTSQALDVDAFEKLPIRAYEDYQPQIQQSMQTQQNFLSRQRPLTHEATSGSSGAKKWIPYPPALLMSFTRMFLCWVYDLVCFGPQLKGGYLYFSVSPQFSDRADGLNDDSDYLQGPSAWILKQFMLVPAQIKHLQQPEDFLVVLAAYLISREDLEVISIWSPSFLQSILVTLQTRLPEIYRDLQKGYVIKQGMRFDFSPLSPSQARRIESWMADPDEAQLSSLFPGLKLISCWAAQNASSGYQQLKCWFPGILIQPKGLLATEAPLTWPSIYYQQDIPMLNEVYFEFLDARGQLLKLHQVEIDQEYELIISQKGGLLRYRLGDFVRITGHAEATACFEFIGRGQDICDLVGEKLSERWLARVVQTHFASSYLCLIPQQYPAVYTLCVDAALNPELKPEVFEAHLMASPHYYNAIALKQLEPLRLLLIPHLSAVLKDYFVRHRQMVRGDIKDRYLYARESDGQLIHFLQAHRVQSIE